MYNSKYLLLSWVNSNLLREVHCGVQAMHLANSMSSTTQYAEWSKMDTDNLLTVFGCDSSQNLACISYVLHAVKKYGIVEDAVVAQFRGKGQRYDLGSLVSTGILLPTVYLNSTPSSFYPVTLSDLFAQIERLEDQLAYNSIKNGYTNTTLPTNISQDEVFELRTAFISWLKNEQRVY